MQQENIPTRLHGYPLLVARCIWGILVISAPSFFLLSLPLYYTHLLSACTGDSNPLCTLHGTLTTTGMQALQRLGIAPATYATYTIVLSSICACLWLAIGLQIFWRRSDDWMALFVSAFLIIYSTNLPAGPPSVLATISSGWAVVVSLMNLDAVSSLGLFFFLFPDGRFVPRWMRWVAAVYILLQIVMLLPPFQGKSFFGAGVQSSWLANLFFVGLLCAMVFAQLNRYWQFKNSEQRQQTKWVIFGSVAAVVGILGADVPYLFIHSLAQSGILELTLNSIFYLVTLPIPLSIGIAVARYRLYDIDVLINRTLIYGTLTCLLVLGYFGLVIALQIVFQPLTGGSQLTIVISTLAIAALFQPLRGFVQHIINRRFYRSRYDAGRILASFGSAMRREIDLQQLREQLITVVEQTLQPTHMTLYYANDRMENLPGSDAQLIEYFSYHPDAVEPEQLPASSSSVQELRKKHTALVVPLMSQGDFTGWLGLGPRRGGQGYSVDDRRLLNTLAVQIAPAIQVAQLVQERQEAALERERVEQELRTAGISPGAVLGRANNLLHPDIPPGMFVTCFYAIIDPHTGLLHYANAGQDLPYRHASGSAVELQARGMPLGLMPDMDYEEQQTLLQPGEGVVFYSDGLVEAHNAAREMFGFPRLARLLGEQSAQTNVIQFFLEQLQTFTGPHWTQEDDITLVTLQRRLCF